MLGLINEDLPYKEPLSYKPTPWDKAVAMAPVRAAINIGGFLEMTGAGIAGLLGMDESQEKFYKSYEEYIKPARERFTPDPQSTGFAGKVLGGLAELGPMMLLGPATLPTIVGSATMNTGADLVDEGVDAKTATLTALGQGIMSGVLMKAPLAGKTISGTAGLATGFVGVNAAQRYLTSEALRSAGYDKQAEMFKAFDPEAVAQDILLSGVFGIMGYRARAGAENTFNLQKKRALEGLNKMKEVLPTEAADAIDLINQREQMIADVPFEMGKPNAIQTHMEALDKAIGDLSEGKRVDVSKQLQNLKRELPESFLAGDFEQQLKDNNIPDDQIKGTMALLDARAKAEGLSTDDFIQKYIADVQHGEGLTEGDFNLKQQHQATSTGKPLTKGAVKFLDDGRAVIYAFKSADITTVVHDLGYVFRRQVKGDDLKTLETWAGVRDSKWKTAHEEKFAKGFERYIAEGKAPTEELKGVFGKLKTWMVDIYRKLVGEDLWRVTLTPKVRKVMDRLFIEEELPVRKDVSPEAIEAQAIAAKAITEVKSEIPQEITVTEDWGVGPTVSRKGEAIARAMMNKKDSGSSTQTADKQAGMTSKKKTAAAMSGRKSIISWVETKGKINYQKEKFKGEIDTLIEGNRRVKGIVDKKGRGLTLDELALMAKEEGYIKEATPEELLKAMEENRVHMNYTEDQINRQMQAEQKRRQANPVVDRVETYIEENGDIAGGRVTGVDRKGEPEYSGARKALEEAKAEIEKTSSTRDIYERMANCIRYEG